MTAAVGGRVFAVPFVYRCHPMVREPLAQAADGSLGEIVTIDCGCLQDGTRQDLLRPERHVGLSARRARETAARVRALLADG